MTNNKAQQEQRMDQMNKTETKPTAVATKATKSEHELFAEKVVSIVREQRKSGIKYESKIKVDEEKAEVESWDFNVKSPTTGTKLHIHVSRKMQQGGHQHTEQKLTVKADGKEVVLTGKPVRDMLSVLEREAWIGKGHRRSTVDEDAVHALNSLI